VGGGPGQGSFIPRCNRIKSVVSLTKGGSTKVGPLSIGGGEKESHEASKRVQPLSRTSEMGGQKFFKVLVFRVGGWLGNVHPGL